MDIWLEMINGKVVLMATYLNRSDPNFGLSKKQLTFESWEAAKRLLPRVRIKFL
jgi:hypothetical protein